MSKPNHIRILALTFCAAFWAFPFIMMVIR